MMNEIHPAVEAGNVQKRRGFTEMHQAAKAYKKATRALLIRALVVAALVAGWVALAFDLVSWQIAIPFEVIAAVWLSFWAGAWVQFRFCKGGLLE